MQVIEISSSQCRRLAAAGEPLEPLVGEEVAGYLSHNGLYRRQARG